MNAFTQFRGGVIQDAVPVYSEQELAKYKRAGWEIVKVHIEIPGKAIGINNKDSTRVVQQQLHDDAQRLMGDQRTAYMWALWEDGQYHCFEWAPTQDW